MTWKEGGIVLAALYLFYGFYHLGYVQGREDLGVQLIPILDSPRRLNEALLRYHAIRDHSDIVEDR